ncbi:protoporphyrinogen oxidase, mitochondrial isoform X2 [Citrus sinensis]|uniref:protoporphyrinogen oxidase, mitochondrial isoform X2 n=1 Tax=Citrus sinensis TaxID=2711 RepID=UPI002278A00D|nr:protoporphyrinogen oxidase, mitochondrial isoform X2 [Citrus sinensis]
MASAPGEDNQRSAKRVAVVGAGVSGLAAAYKLKSNGVNVMVFEADERAGGKLRSISKDGLIWDEGANTMTESEMEVKGLLDDLGIREKQQFPISQYKRSFLSPFCGRKVTLRKCLLRMQKKGFPLFLICSVGGFFQRHFGREVVDFLIDPFVAGTSAADPESLVMRHSFPELWNLEKRYGSVIAGAIKSKFSARKEKSAEAKGSSEKKHRQRGSFSFLGGMQTLTDALCKALGKDEVCLKSKVLSLSYSHDGKSALENWSLSSSNQDKQSQGLSFDAVIMTASLCNVKEMKITKGGNLFPLDFLPEVIYMPLSVFITAFKKENVGKPLQGFGVLVPSKEQQNGLKTLGTLFSSMMFPDRAPKDLFLYTTFVGGSRNKELAKASTDELKQIVTSDLRQLLGVEGEPTFVNHFFWSKAFPLYGRDYDSVLEAIEKMEKNLPGFFYAGNHKGGLSVGKSIASGCKAAELVISYLENSSDDKMLKEGSSK